MGAEPNVVRDVDVVVAAERLAFVAVDARIVGRRVGATRRRWIGRQHLRCVRRQERLHERPVQVVHEEAGIFRRADHERLPGVAPIDPDSRVIGVRRRWSILVAVKRRRGSRSRHDQWVVCKRCHARRHNQGERQRQFLLHVSTSRRRASLTTACDGSVSAQDRWDSSHGFQRRHRLRGLRRCEPGGRPRRSRAAGHSLGRLESAKSAAFSKSAESAKSAAEQICVICAICV